MFDELLAQFGLDRTKLTAEEQDTLRGWAESLNQGALSPADIENGIAAMKDGIARELCEPPKTITDWLHRRKRRDYLLARFENYMMILDFVQRPAKARKFVEAQLKRMKPHA